MTHRPAYDGIRSDLYDPRKKRSIKSIEGEFLTTAINSNILNATLPPARPANRSRLTTPAKLIALVLIALLGAFLWWA